MVMALTLKHASEQEFRRRPDGDVPPRAGGRPHDSPVCDTWEVSPGKDLVERRCRSRHRSSSAQAPRPAPDVSSEHGSGVRQPIRRRRFTIAHELGHWICQYRAGRPARFYCRSGDVAAAADRAAEREANVFAAELLMPEPAVRAAWGEEPEIAACAERFSVSSEAMHWRLYNLGLVEERPA